MPKATKLKMPFPKDPCLPESCESPSQIEHKAFVNPFKRFEDLFSEPVRPQSTDPSPSLINQTNTEPEPYDIFESSELRGALSECSSIESIYWMYKFLRRGWYGSAPTGTPLTDSAYRQAVGLPPIDHHAHVPDPSEKWNILACSSRDELWLTRRNCIPQRVKSPWTIPELTAYHDHQHRSDKFVDRALEELATKYNGWIPFGERDYNRAKMKERRGFKLTPSDRECLREYIQPLSLMAADEKQYQDARERFQDLRKDPKYFAQLVAERGEDFDYLEEAINQLSKKPLNRITRNSARLFRSRSTTQGKIHRRLTEKELFCGRNRSAKGTLQEVRESVRL